MGDQQRIFHAAAFTSHSLIKEFRASLFVNKLNPAGNQKMMSFLLLQGSYKLQIIIISFDELIDDVAVYDGATIFNVALYGCAVDPIGAGVFFLGKR